MLTGFTRRLEALPLMQCGYRPFFLAVAWFAVLEMLLWGGVLWLGLPLPATAGGPIAWHVHELLYGFGLAAVAGFLLTAVPEFTSSPAWPTRTTLSLFAAWLAARIAFAASGPLGPWPAALANVGLVLALAALVASRVLSDERARRHSGFLGALLVLAVTAAGFHVETIRGGDAMRWLHAGIGPAMILIVLAMSRISTRMVNDALDAQRATGDDPGDAYRAPPPRRNFAIAAIAAYTVVEWLAPGSAVAGWLALAVAATVLNLMSDWHRGRVLFDRWVLMLYACYLAMALGYATIGFAHLYGFGTASAGRHLLTIGAMSLSIYAAMSIAGRRHGGWPLETRAWLPIGAAALFAAALMRAGAGFGGPAAGVLLQASALLWIAVFLQWALRSHRVLTGPRPDGRVGCQDDPVEAPALAEAGTKPASAHGGAAGGCHLPG